MKDTPTVDERRSASARVASGVRAGDVSGSARHTVRIGSSVAEFSEISAAADQIQLQLLEVSAGITLERVMRHHGIPLPDGDLPYCIDTIAASVARLEPESVEQQPPVQDRPTSPFQRGSRTITTDPSTELVHVPRTSRTLAVFDAGFAGEQIRRSQASRIEKPAVAVSIGGVPGDGTEAPTGFPGFRLNTTMTEWVTDNVDTEDVSETAVILGTSSSKAHRQLDFAMTIVHGLPRFADRVRAGEFTMAHIQVVADLCRSVAFRYLPRIDDLLAERRADVTSDRLRTSLRKFINILEPADDRSKVAAQRRRVDLYTYENGSACLSLSGPADELHACYQRIEAMARAIHSRKVGAFNLPPGVAVVDERSVDNLMYDIATRPQPKLCIRVRRIDPVTGVESVSEEPLLDDEGNLLFGFTDDGEIVLNGGSGQDAAAHLHTHAEAGGTSAQHAGNAAPAGSAAGGSAFSATGLNEPQILEYFVSASMPTQPWWLANQAGLITTVPVMTLLGESDLPGTLPDGSPIPAETARRIAGHCSTLTRILTDPATGTPIDAKATTYRVPDSVRKTLIAQWEYCSVPGCPRKARKAETDHVIPFFKLDPLKGGLTRFGNLHPLCGKHHALKTAGRFRVRMTESGVADYEFRHGVKTRSRAPDQPIDVAHALEFAALCGLSPGPAPIPDHLIPPPKDTIEVPPAEELIREREEVKRRAEEAAERARLWAEREEKAREARFRRTLDLLLHWKDIVHPACLPPGSDPVTMKRLVPGRRETWQEKRIRKERAGDAWVEPIGCDWEQPISHYPNRNVWKVPDVQWDHDCDDPPPF